MRLLCITEGIILHTNIPALVPVKMSEDSAVGAHGSDTVERVCVLHSRSALSGFDYSLQLIVSADERAGEATDELITRLNASDLPDFIPLRSWGNLSLLL